jgi:hypothetical protein
VSTATVDVSTRESIQALVQTATELGDVTGVIHAAGVSPTQASPATILKVDLYGTALVLEEFGNVIACGGAGVVIASQSGHRLPALTVEQNAALATTSADELFFDFHANRLQIESHLLQHNDCHSLSEFDQSEQKVFSSHVIVVEPLGLLARKRQDLLGAWRKITHHYVPLPSLLTLLKVDTTSAFQYLTSKPKEIKEIEYCGEYQSSVLRGESPAEPKLTTLRKAQQLLVHR